MLLLALSSLVVLASSVFFYYGREAVTDYAVTQYKRFRELNQLVSTQHKNVCSVFLVSCEMILKMWWITFLQYVDTRLEPLDKKTSVLSYVLKGRLYKMLVHHRTGPPKVFLVLDQDSQDVSDLVLPFLGPQRDWHHHTFSPSFWKKESLTFEMTSGESKTFKGEEDIELDEEKDKVNLVSLLTAISVLCFIFPKDKKMLVSDTVSHDILRCLTYHGIKYTLVDVSQLETLETFQMFLTDRIFDPKILKEKNTKICLFNNSLEFEGVDLFISPSKEGYSVRGDPALVKQIEEWKEVYGQN